MIAEMPPAAAPDSVELPPPVTVDVVVAVELAEPASVAVALPEEPSAEERIERALTPVVAEVEAEERASVMLSVG